MLLLLCFLFFRLLRRGFPHGFFMVGLLRLLFSPAPSLRYTTQQHKMQGTQTVPHIPKFLQSLLFAPTSGESFSFLCYICFVICRVCNCIPLKTRDRDAHSILDILGFHPISFFKSKTWWFKKYIVFILASKQCYLNMLFRVHSTRMEGGHMFQWTIGYSCWWFKEEERKETTPILMNCVICPLVGRIYAIFISLLWCRWFLDLQQLGFCYVFLCQRAGCNAVSRFQGLVAWWQHHISSDLQASAPVSLKYLLKPPGESLVQSA